MDRKQFIGSLALGATSAGAALGLQSASSGTGPDKDRLGSGVVFAGSSASGVRRLGSDKNFTVYRAGIEPSYRVQLGEVVLVETQHGLPGQVTRDGTFRQSKPGDKVNPGTGPIYVEGIGAGDALAIDILEVRVGDWGYCGGRIFELGDGYAVFDEKLRLPLSPMIGVVGIVPAQGEMDTKAPRETGGNMDCKEVRTGSTLVFTAQVEGALAGMGDAHALQGDGETRGQGLECDAEVLCRFRKLPAKLSDRPVIVRPEFVATLGALPDLNEAAWQATDDMVSLVARLTARDRESARILVSLVGNLKINQIVDPSKGARMEVPTWVFGV